MFKNTFKHLSPGGLSRRSERSSVPAEADETTPDTTSPDSGIRVESVLEDSDLDEDAASRDSKGTTYSFSDANELGKRQFLGPNRCKVILAAKTTDNRQVVCSHLFGSCSRKKHSLICQDPKRVAPSGYYRMTPSSKGGADGILETHMSEEEMQEEKLKHRETNRDLSTKLFTPTGELRVKTERTSAHIMGSPAEFAAIPPESFFMQESEKPPVVATRENLKPSPVYSAMVKSNLKPAPPLGPPPKKPAPVVAKGSSGPTPKTATSLTKEDLQAILTANNQATAAIHKEQAQLMRIMIADFSRCSEAIHKSLQQEAKTLPVPKFFAVRKGVLTAVGQGTDQLQKILVEHPEASHQVFDTEKEAQQWLANPSGSLAINDQGLSTAPLVSGPTYTSYSKPATQQQSSTLKTAFVDPTLGALMHIRGNGPDESTGTPNEIFGIKLMDRRVTEARPTTISAATVIRTSIMGANRSVSSRTRQWELLENWPRKRRSCYGPTQTNVLKIS